MNFFSSITVYLNKVILVLNLYFLPAFLLFMMKIFETQKYLIIYNIKEPFVNNLLIFFMVGLVLWIQIFLYFLLFCFKKDKEKILYIIFRIL